jgi:hypothetical protein
MKTILMPIFHGHISRNIFLTDIYKTLSDKKDLRIVVLTYDFKVDYYKEKFGKENVLVEGLDVDSIEKSSKDWLFKNLFHMFVNTPRVKQVFRGLLDEDKRYFAYATRRIGCFVLGNSRFLRNSIRKSYYQIIKPKKVIADIFDRYKPDGVFLPDMTYMADTYILRAAKERGIPSVAMLRSFDVLTSNKGTIRIYPDHLIVHNEWMKFSAMKWADMNGERISIGGMPHFDYYFKDQPTPREDFLKSLGADPSKRIILFALTGPRTTHANQDIIDIISGAMKNGELPGDVQLLVSMHPNAETEKLSTGKDVIACRPAGKYFHGARLTDMEFTPEWRQWLFDVIYHSAVTVNAQGTMSIDASAIDRPVINVVFDGYQNPPKHKKIKCFYVLDHYLSVMKTGGVKLVYNPAELIEWINRYLSNPNIHREGRYRIIKEQCHFVDSTAAEKTAKLVIDHLDL